MWKRIQCICSATWFYHHDHKHLVPWWISPVHQCGTYLTTGISSEKQAHVRTCHFKSRVGWSRGLLKPLWLKAPDKHPLQPDTHMQRHLSPHGWSYLHKLTLAGVWIQMAALNRMWSHSCFSSGAPCVRLSRYFAKERKCSNTALVMCTRDDCRKKHKVTLNNNHFVYVYSAVSVYFSFLILIALLRATSCGNCSGNVSLHLK